MSILTELESLIAPLEADVKAAWGAMKAEEKYLAGLLYSDVKLATGTVESTIVAALPEAVSQLKAYALQCVKSLMANVAFKNAVGQWKFGVVCSQILQAVEQNLFPGAMALIKTIGISTIETAVQAAFAAVVVSA